jgi:histidine triad (HIT) family protein
MGDCVFCRIVAEEEPATFVANWEHCIAIEPINPVTPGHVLVIPRRHVADFTESAYESAEAMRLAALLAREIGPCNLITSKGSEATQSVFHLHLHLVPRAANDGLALPWTPPRRTRNER